MEAQEEKNKQKEVAQQIDQLEQQMKSTFKEGDYEAVKLVAYKIKALNPNSRLAEKMIKKVQKIKEKAEEVVREEKIKEYIAMLKKLYKEKNVEKLTDLAKEFKSFNPESRHADKWIKRADELKQKLTAKAGSDSGEEKKPGFFANLFKKSKATTEPEKKNESIQGPVSTPTLTNFVTPGIPVAPVVPVALVMPEKAISKEENAPKEAKGNIFTKMFNKKEGVTDTKSIIDTIVAKTDKKEEMMVSEAVDEQKLNKDDSHKLLIFSKVFMNLAAIFIVFSAAFLYVEWIDKESTMLSLMGIPQNTGGRLHGAAEEVNALKKRETLLSRNIELYKGGYDDKALSMVDQIIGSRINWPDIFSKISEVTNSVYELNDFFKYIEYNNYSFDAEKGAIRVTGSLSDPLGRNLTKLVELEEAFKYYPKDRNNLDDTTKPYFTGFKEFTSFSKTLDESTGRYTSSFQLSFLLND